MKKEVKSKISKYTKYLLSGQVFSNNKRFVFILSHQRSRSTLLSHLLGANDEICGHRELHAKYNNEVDIFKAKVNLYVDCKDYEKSTYLLDKLLHNRLEINEHLFNVPPKIIFLLRCPNDCMRSMVVRHLQHNSIETIEKLPLYYRLRVSWLMDFWDNTNLDKIFIESDSIINNSDEIFQDISGFLQLTTKISSEYTVYNDTGVSGLGDMSENIKQGKIINVKNDNLSSLVDDALSRIDIRPLDILYNDFINKAKIY